MLVIKAAGTEGICRVVKMNRMLCSQGKEETRGVQILEVKSDPIFIVFSFC